MLIFVVTYIYYPPRLTWSYMAKRNTLVHFMAYFYTCPHSTSDKRTFHVYIRRVIDKIVSFFHRIIIYGWIYITSCRYQQQSVVNRKKTFKCKVLQLCDVTVKTLEGRCWWCILSGYKYYSTSAITVKSSDDICT